ncbi:MAG: hypothetical protein H6667_14050 [Ardenticatenaceae bacterium]|nr:hypothetical protein [Ardenticatenaceae bacterium]MCB9444180.1 hypothetical protein [Ardenticatenaceae bacterium]
MKTPRQGQNWFFVDESGDPTFYDRHGNLIVGHSGCSPILILGFVEIPNPHSVRQSLLKLQRDVVSDPYFQKIPSMRKTTVAFHAKDDLPEIRYLVFKQLAALEFRAQFVVARKIERVFRNNFQAKEERFYDHLVSNLFERVLHLHEHNLIYFAKRGSRDRQQPLAQAIQKGVKQFEQRFNTSVRTTFDVLAQTPTGEPCLSVIDYMNWAVYRAFTKREMRYFEVVADKVSLLIDWYDTVNYPKNWYNRKNPFDIEKTTPL